MCVPFLLFSSVCPEQADPSAPALYTRVFFMATAAPAKLFALLFLAGFPAAFAAAIFTASV